MIKLLKPHCVAINEDPVSISKRDSLSGKQGFSYTMPNGQKLEISYYEMC